MFKVSLKFAIVGGILFSQIMGAQARPIDPTSDDAFHGLGFTNDPQIFDRHKVLMDIESQINTTKDQLSAVELRLEYISQSEHAAILNTLLENRTIISSLTITAGMGTTALAIKNKLGAKMIGGGALMLGSGLYLAFSQRAQVYEKAMTEIAKLNSEEVELYVAHKLDEYDQLYDQLIRLKDLRLCVRKAAQASDCL